LPAVALLEVKGLQKDFGGATAVAGVDFALEAGEFVGLIGPNGSGKTTLFNLLSGVLKPTKGEIRFDGRRIDGWPPDRIFHAGLVRTFQVPRLFRNMTTLENALLPPEGQLGESPWHASGGGRRRCSWRRKPVRCWRRSSWTMRRCKRQRSCPAGR